jgi:hypothetical protein
MKEVQKKVQDLGGLPLSDWRASHRRGKYAWPESPGIIVVFPLEPADILRAKQYGRSSTECAQTRIVNASRMTYWRRKLHWNYHTRVSDNGILFMWKGGN